MIGRPAGFDDCDMEEIWRLTLDAEERDIAARETGLAAGSFARRFTAYRAWGDSRFRVNVRGPRGAWLQRYIERRDKGHRAELDATRTLVTVETRRRSDDLGLTEIKGEVLASIKDGDACRMAIRSALDVYMEPEVVGWWPLPDMRWVDSTWWSRDQD